MPICLLRDPSLQGSTPSQLSPGLGSPRSPGVVGAERAWKAVGEEEDSSQVHPWSVDLLPTRGDIYTFTSHTAHP